MAPTKIAFDFREGSLIDMFKNAHSSWEEDIEVINLEIGDVHILMDDQPCIIIERKTVADLAQSIKDNRYREQKARQLAYREMNPNVKLVYMIEGSFKFDPKFRCQNMDSRSLSGAFINSVFRDNIHVVSTTDVTDSAYFIDGLFERFKKDPGVYLNNVVARDKSSYDCNISSAVKQKRKDNIDNKACFMMQMSCIPGISGKKANDIMTVLNVRSIVELIELLKKDPKMILSVDGIGKKLGETLMNFLGFEKNETK